MSAGPCRWTPPSAGLTSIPPAPGKRAPGRAEPGDHALGRSRGGPSTKVHLASDGHARPLALRVTAGQAGDAPAFETVMAAIRVPRGRPGRPRTRPDTVLADRAYSSRAIRSHLRRRGIRAGIPQPSDQIGHRLRRGRAGGRPPAFDAESYKQRNTVERCINRLRQWHGLAMRTDKLAVGRTPPRRHPHLDPAVDRCQRSTTQRASAGQEPVPTICSTSLNASPTGTVSSSGYSSCCPLDRTNPSLDP